MVSKVSSDLKTPPWYTSCNFRLRWLGSPKSAGANVLITSFLGLGIFVLIFVLLKRGCRNQLLSPVSGAVGNCASISLYAKRGSLRHGLLRLMAMFRIFSFPVLYFGVLHNKCGPQGMDSRQQGSLRLA